MGGRIAFPTYTRTAAAAVQQRAADMTRGMNARQAAGAGGSNMFFSRRLQDVNITGSRRGGATSD